VAGLYVHVPFCRTRCRYCAFVSSRYETGRAGRYLAALEVEAAAARPALAALAPDTLYLGGGTPTALSPGELRRLVEIISSTGAPGSVQESTVEANPGTLDARRLAVLREFGFGRVSLGAQSFRDAELEFLGRSHRAAEIAGAVRAARRAGFRALSLDLIFGLPAQRPEEFAESLEAALKLEPEHVSLYGLTCEPGTPLAAEMEAGRLAPCSQEAEREMYLAAAERLTRAGFEHYEIASFARPGQRCGHNQNYWRGGEYLGLGAGAFSYTGGERRGNVGDVDEYSARLESGRDPVAERERLAPEKKAREALMLELRLREGADLAGFRERTGFDPRALFGEAWDRHLSAGLLEVAAGRLRLTLEGVLVANSVMADFI